MDLSTLSYIYVGFAALLVGFTKTSVGGVGILAVLLMALAVPGKASPGLLLPLLIAADIMAVLYYRRSCQWKLLARLLPMALIGVVLGYFVLQILPEGNFTGIIGWIILSMLVLDLGLSESIKRHASGWIATFGAGVIAGAASMIANAAGPVFSIYLLQFRLDKTDFVGTRSWYFLLLNISKIPFAVGLGLVTPATLTLDLMYLPILIVGAILGRIFLRYINMSVFKVLIRVAVLVSAARLILF